MNKRSLIQMLTLISALTVGVALPAAADGNRGHRAEAGERAVQPVHYSGDRRHDSNAPRYSRDRREWRHEGDRHGHGYRAPHRGHYTHWAPPRGHHGRYVPHHAPMRHGYYEDHGDGRVGLSIIYRGLF